MKPTKEHFRGVIWPRHENDGTYRYVVVGMLITDKPLEGLHENETVIDGTLTNYTEEMGIAGALERMPKFHPASQLGDANRVLLSLNEIVGEPFTSNDS